jgi:hypothetical protein
LHQRMLGLSLLLNPFIKMSVSTILSLLYLAKKATLLLPSLLNYLC